MVLLIFFLAYFGIVLRRDKGLYFVYGATLIFLLMKVITLRDIPTFINYNVLGIFLGTSILSFLFTFSQVPGYLVEKIMRRGYGVGIIYLLICVITSFISIFVENVATILIMAPVAFEFTRKFKLNPVPLFIGMAVSSNLQGCATMVGDSPSIILAMESGMNFNNFFYMPPEKLTSAAGKPGIFFFVQFGAILSFIVLYLIFRKDRRVFKIEKETIKVKSWVPSVLLGLMIISLALTSFLQNKFGFFPAAICLFYGMVGILWYISFHNGKINLRNIDWESFFLLIGIFILVGTLKKTGFIDKLADIFIKTGKDKPFLLYTLIVWISVFASSFVDNIPYTMAMIDGVKIMCASLNLNPYIYFFGLLIGSCVGGNITPIGASCNVVGVGLLKKKGYRVSFTQFLKIGFPFTIVAVAGSAFLMWFVYKF